ncbi:hypothetical protein [Leptospira santarosai]|uniref:hypothetical protein n=2 Tax=Leptospira santarosai TaxID=28183 RepID=UPI000518CA4B|nr:hypothetical protein [Leptospira santarosai]MDI7183351.1 hypothetical protein [Leptospira santarosai]
MKLLLIFIVSLTLSITIYQVFSKTEIHKTKEVFIFTRQHREILRNMVVIWDSSESGAPIIDIFNFPFSYKTIGSLLGISDFDSKSKDLGPFRDTVEAIFEIGVQHGNLKPGTYTYKNPLKGIKENRWQLDSYSKRLFPIPKKDSITFTVTEKHIQLLKKSNARWLNYWELPGIDSKRPYGNMTCFYLDMADIFEIEIPTEEDKSCRDSFSKEQIETFDKFHLEMFYTLQTYLLFAEMNPGSYSRENAYSKWHKTQ